MASVLDALIGSPDPLDSYRTPPINPVNNYSLTAPEHKGVFGLKGGLRDIVGILGDALSKSHTYTSARQREKESDALINFGTDPLSAVQSMMNVNPDKGMELQNMLAKQEAEKKQSALMDAYRQAQIEAARVAKQQKGSGILSGYLGAFKNDPRAADSYKKALGGLRKVAEDYGIQDVYTLPDEYDGDTISRLAYAGMNPAQQAGDEDRDRNLASTIEDREVRQGIARERLGVSRESAANSAANRSASLAERARHNRESEAIARERNGGKGKPKVQLQMPPGMPKAPPGFTFKKRN